MNREIVETAKLMQEADYGFVICDEWGKVVWINPSFTALCGYELPEMQGKKTGPILQGAGTDPQAAACLRSAVRQRKPARVRILNYHKDGHSYWADILLNFVSATPKHPAFFTAVEVDVTPDVARESELCREVVDLYSCVLSMTDSPPQMSSR